jgi:hypothetical protein
VSSVTSGWLAHAAAGVIIAMQSAHPQMDILVSMVVSLVVGDDICQKPQLITQ